MTQVETLKKVKTDLSYVNEQLEIRLKSNLEEIANLMKLKNELEKIAYQTNIPEPLLHQIKPIYF